MDKPTLVVGGETLLQRHLRQAETAGISRFLIVANKNNMPAVLAMAGRANHLSIEVCQQQGPDAEGAILTGLKHVSEGTPIYIGCTNDIVPDDTYERLGREAITGCDMLVVSAYLKWHFSGGLLILRRHLNRERVLRIVELDADRCTPGSSVNVFIHVLCKEWLRHSLVAALSSGISYEEALNKLIVSNVLIEAMRVASWVGLKKPADLVRAQSEFGLDSDVSWVEPGARS